MNRLLFLLVNLMICALTQISAADDLLLTLDLRNTYRNDPLSGGTWQLYVRKVETGTEPQGDFGVSGVRALLDDISPEGITFAAGIGQSAGGPFINTLNDGTVEVIYQQDLNGTVVEGVGINALRPNRDTLIASGMWPAGPRPGFGMDPENNSSSGEFLGSDAPPYLPSVSASNTATLVVTLGDFNSTDTINNLDTALLIARLPGASPSLPYHPATDINQDGLLNSLDIAGYIVILSGPNAPVSSTLSTIPEPSISGAVIVGSICLMGRRTFRFGKER